MTKQTRQLQYDDRVAIQQADQAIKKDVRRALIELITNANDSYQLMEDLGQTCTGEIIVEIRRGYKNTPLIRVRDYAQGMDDSQMDKAVGTYGGATSGFTKGKSVRGLWGRGLKDSIFGLGHGAINSIKNDIYYNCSLKIINGKPTFELEEPLKASRSIRKQLEISIGNGTCIEITVSREDITIPQFDSLRRFLERHFELRTLLMNPRRRVILTELDPKGNPKEDETLEHKPPIGTNVLNEKFYLAKCNVEIHLEVFRSDVPLSMPSEEGEIADGGFLISSKHVDLALTMFKYEHNEYANKFYGKVACSYLHELLSKDQPEPILTATRDGIDWKHPFMKELKSAVELKLEPLIEDEKKRMLAEQKSTLSKKMQERLDVALRELNTIAKMELGSIGDGIGDGPEDDTPVMPLGGFGFVPAYLYLQSGKPALLTLRGQIPDKVQVGSLIKIESDNSEVTVLTTQVIIDQRKDFPNLGQAHIQIEGRQVGAEAIITAYIGDLKAEAMVKVVSKKVAPVDPPAPRTKGALIRGYRFDNSGEPRQRVKFERASSEIVVSTKAPSVSAYFDESGNGIETAQGQVFLAELITEAACREMARRCIESGKVLTLPGKEADAIQLHYILLQNKYAHRVHACMVEQRYRRDSESNMRKVGRPKREEAMTKVVSEV